MGGEAAVVFVASRRGACVGPVPMTVLWACAGMSIAGRASAKTEAGSKAVMGGSRSCVGDAGCYGRDCVSDWVLVMMRSGFIVLRSLRALEDWVSDRGPFRFGLVGWHGRAVGEGDGRAGERPRAEAED